MSETEIRDRVIEIINSVLENLNITPEQCDVELLQLGMQSISFISIVVALEEAFEIEVPDECLLVSNMGTANKMIKVVSKAIAMIN